MDINFKYLTIFDRPDDACNNGSFSYFIIKKEKHAVVKVIVQDSARDK